MTSIKRVAEHGPASLTVESRRVEKKSWRGRPIAANVFAADSEDEEEFIYDSQPLSLRSTAPQVPGMTIPSEEEPLLGGERGWGWIWLGLGVGVVVIILILRAELIGID